MAKPILVTGSHRSGSTWTGNVIAASDAIRYLHEPFNLDLRHHAAPFPYWYMYLGDRPAAEQAQARAYLESFSGGPNRYDLQRLLRIRSKPDLRRYVEGLRGRYQGKRLLVKDPIALMSAEWIYRNLGWSIVVLIRHPAAFVASIKVKNWEVGFDHLLRQPGLLQAYLKPYAETIAEYTRDRKDIIAQGILMWNVVYGTVAQYRARYGEQWFFARHEDLSLDPFGAFERMFAFLDLPFDQAVRSFIQNSTRSEEAGRLTRNSAENIKTWKQRLSPEEIERVKTGTQAVWSQYYSHTDW